MSVTTRTAQQRRVIELAMNAAGADDDCEAFAVIRALASDLAESGRKLATMRGLAAEAWPFVQGAARNYGPPGAKAWLAAARAILGDDKGERVIPLWMVSRLGWGTHFRLVMAENSEQAAEFAGWGTNGCEVTQVMHLAARSGVLWEYDDSPDSRP